MTTEELRAAYPGAADAVIAHEYLVLPSVWEVLRNYTMSECMDALKRTAEDYRDNQDYIRWNLDLCREQMDQPDFHRYVAAKLGAF